jgi:hypothetical protein
MKIINENPYRTLGLPVNSTIKEQNRQITRLKHYMAAKQEPPHDDYSFATLGNLKRTTESVDEAASKLNLDRDRMEAALFWLYNGRTITDESAFDALKEGSIEEAYQIWDKLITETKEDGKRYWKAVTERNHSAFHNCFVVNMLWENGNIRNGIVGNLYFLENDLVQNFVAQVTDITYKTTPKELQLIFLNAISNEIHISKLIPIIQSINFSAKADFLKAAIQRLIEPIERKIEATKFKRKANRANAVQAGNELYKTVQGDLQQLKIIVADMDTKYASVADKVANEILQCGIEYFNHYKETATDPGSNSMALFNLAKKLAIGSFTKQCIEENIEGLQAFQHQDCYRAVDLLKAIKELYLQLDKENQTFALNYDSIYHSYYDRKVVNEIKVIEVIKTEISEKVIKRIASCSNQQLINEFYDLLKYIYGRMNRIELFEIEKILYNCLPNTSNLKATISQVLNTRASIALEQKRIEKEKQRKGEIEKEKEERRKKLINRIKYSIMAIFVIMGVIVGSLAIPFPIGLFAGGLVGLASFCAFNFVFNIIIAIIILIINIIIRIINIFGLKKSLIDWPD